MSVLQILLLFSLLSLALAILFHIFQPLWSLKFAEVKLQKYITAYVI